MPMQPCSGCYLCKYFDLLIGKYRDESLVLHVPYVNVKENDTDVSCRIDCLRLTETQLLPLCLHRYSRS